MKFLFNLQRIFDKIAKSIIISAISIAIVFCSNLSPAIALSQISTVIEEQVLQILREHPEAIIESIERYQKQQYEEQQKLTRALLEEFQKTPEKLIAQSPVTGDIQDKIILVEFSDFQCPYCRRVSKTVSKFIKKHRARVVLVYKHYPLNIHPQALPAASAAIAAAQQNKFWEYHDALFKNQQQLGESLYVATAKKLGLDIEKFNRDRNSSQAQAAIEQDMQLANQLGINGTPLFVMKDKVFSGAVELSEFEKLLAEVS
ncbi:MAG: thioredoxin domain-containing protein [Cyanobacteria bacterium J06635_10]